MRTHVRVAVDQQPACSIARHWLLMILLAASLLILVPARGASANGTLVVGQDGHAPGLEAQVQIPGFDFNPTKWVQDAFGALLQVWGGKTSR